MRPVNIKKLQARSKSLRLRMFDPAEPGDPYTAVVESGSNPALNQIVTVYFEADGHISARCTCTWAQYGGIACSHVLAALSRLASRNHRLLSFWLSPDEARRQKQRMLQLSGDGDAVWITSRGPAEDHEAASHAGNGHAPAIDRITLSPRVV